MPREKSRLDESLSMRAWRKSLTGDSGVRIDWSKIRISKDGELEPANSLPDPSAEQEKTAQG